MTDQPVDPFEQIMRDNQLDERLARLSGRAAASTNAGGDAPKAPKRRSAARGSRRTALGLSAVSTLGLAGWMYQNAQVPIATATPIADTASSTATAAPATSAASTASTASTGAATASTTTTRATTSSSTGLADGTFKGSTVSTKYGPLQATITVSGGRITAVTVPTTPANDRKSVAINASAVPRLVQATLTAQSSKVSNVSGATYTSTAYRTSLQAAIDAAKKA